MATKDLTVTDKLRLLFDLQSVDSQLDELEVLKGELPIEVSDLKDEIAGLEKRIEKMNAGLGETNELISKHDNGIQESKALIERYTKQLDEVKNNREFEALTKEIELQNLEIKLHEKKIAEANKQVEVQKEIQTATVEKKDKRAENLETKKVELKEIIKKTEKAEKKLQKESLAARKNVDERLLKSYDKIRSTYRNGLAVVTVKRDSCGGCFNKIPPQLQLEIGMKKKIMACEHCGRILVDGETAGVEEPVS